MASDHRVIYFHQKTVKLHLPPSTSLEVRALKFQRRLFSFPLSEEFISSAADSDCAAEFTVITLFVHESAGARWSKRWFK